MKTSGCGFILEDPRGILLCHATNCGNRWDIPKGNAEHNEDHFECALRELYEETGLILSKEDLDQVQDLEQHPYQKHRDLHLYYLKFKTNIDVRALKCTSIVTNTKKPPFPEMDAFAVFPLKSVPNKIGKGFLKWIEDYTTILD